MPSFRELDGEQIRQLINTEQVYEAFRAVQSERRLRFSGSMSWKTVRGREYLYRKKNGQWRSLGPRDDATEEAYERFRSGRANAKARQEGLDARIRRLAAVNRAMGLGRVPWPAARLLRRLERAKLLGQAISVVGTQALYAYERLAGGQFAQSHVSTDDIDLLFDARSRLRLLSPDVREEGLSGLLRGIDASFQPVAAGGFRAVNDAGFIVDLIMPMPARPAHGAPGRIGQAPDDMTAAEIEGLQWLQNSPQIAATVIDEKGFPLRLDAPDPRAFALHKLWVSERPDRDRIKARRDAEQARAVAALVLRYLPQLRFDDAALGALPAALRSRAQALVEASRGHALDLEEWS